MESALLRRWRSAAAVAGLAAVAATASDTRVPPASTQLPASRLLESAAVVRAAERLASTTDRVTVSTIGRSAEGRPIPMIAITAGGATAGWQQRARKISGPDVRYTTLTSASIDEVPLEQAVSDARVPILLAGASWGHEASQVEGLLAAAEYLAGDRSSETERLLSRVVVLIVPLMNPDGRDRAIAEWKRTPLSNGDSGVGNGNGFMLNRDFVHQTQPESKALLDVVREWRPLVGIDMHEDVNRLGLAFPEVAFVPPYMPGFDVEEEPGMRKAITAIGDVIATWWRAAGYAIVHDPAGDRRWVPLPPRGSGELNPVAGSSGRLEFLFNIHSVVGLITESARTPGTQTWEARVEQKKLAALATVEAAARNPEELVRIVRARREAKPGQKRAAEFVTIPHAQPVGADRDELIRLLREHDVLVYRAKQLPYDVIPLEQPEAPFIRHAVLAERSKLNDLPSALGVQIVRAEQLDSSARDRLMGAPLELYESRPASWPQSRSPVTVAVYSGQGVDRGSSGEISLVLRNGGMSPIALGEADVRSGNFHGVAVVVFGDGSAREIVDGWDPAAPTRMPPWEPAEPRRGIGREGLDALGRFAREGGRVVTFGRSAGLVAPSLVDVALSAVRPGIGEVQVEIPEAGRSLFAGVPSEAGHARAFIYAPPGGAEGGYLFKPKSAAQVSAWYAGADDRPAEQSFADTAPLARTAGHAAIVSAPVGRGRVVLFGFSPVFRAQWRSTFPLLFNAIAGR
jgi:hypothetical protein